VVPDYLGVTERYSHRLVLLVGGHRQSPLGPLAIPSKRAVDYFLDPGYLDESGAAAGW